MEGLSSKVAVITGGASGIGRATAIKFSELGAAVALLDIQRDRGNEVVEQIRSLGGDALFIKTDVSRKEQVSSAAKKIRKEFGRVDFLINNAGIEYNEIGNIIKMPYAKMRHILEVNLMGAINCSRSFAPIIMRNGDGGRIVNVSSVQGLGSLLPGTSYQATKSGLIGLTHALAVELAPKINVNAIAPGAIATEGMGKVEDRRVIRAFRQKIPLSRRGTDDEIAGPIAFLCSEYSTYITGTVLVVDGGYTIGLTPDLLRKNVKRVKNDPDN